MPKPVFYTVFHLNLAFSSIEESERKTVIERCYWPILRLAEQFPLGIEATGYTLRAIAALSPDWIDCLRQLVADQKVELVGSGAAQVIGPLVPPEVTRHNLRLGNIDYMDLLGVQPKLALINEQAYAPGLLPLYKEAGYQSVMMDWAEAASHHPEWPSNLSGRPQRICGAGVEMPVIWSDAISFQKFQRYAHGELGAEEYFEFLTLQLDKNVMALPIYTSDAEVFDYRPGRFSSEADLGAMMEYERIQLLFKAIAESGMTEPVLPSAALSMMDPNKTPINIETAAAPVTVKKQRKYNLLRWAATGQSDLMLNTHCWRLFSELNTRGDVDDIDWRALLGFWASDFRTHITQARWAGLQESLTTHSRTATSPGNSALMGSQAKESNLPPGCECRTEGRNYIVQLPGSHLVLNTYRGLAIQAFGFGEYQGSAAGAPGDNSLIGTLAHGYFDDIEYGADFYSGHFVFEPADSGKVSDLERCEVSSRYDDTKKALAISTRFATRFGDVEKSIFLSVEDNSLEVEYQLEWNDELWGSFRLGHVMLNPRAFQKEQLYFACHNGGDDLEYHRLFEKGELLTFDHSKPVNKLVSASMGVGMTGGVLVLGDERRRVRLQMDRNDAAGIGMIACRPVRDSYFLRGMISLRETDETARRAPYSLSPAIKPLRIRYSVSLEQ